MSIPIKLVLGLVVALLLATGCSAASAPNTQGSPPPAEATATTPSGGAAPTSAVTATAAATDTTAPTATIAPTVTPTSANPLAAIANAVNSFGTVKTYRMTVTIQGGPPSQNGTFMMEFAGANGFHIVSSRGEFYRIGNTFYVKQSATSPWLKFTTNVGTSATSTFFAPRDLVAKATTSKNVSLVGPDILNGQPMLVYQYTPDPTQDPRTVSAKLWVGVTDQLPYQAIGMDKDGSTVTVVFSDYNATITLTPPIP
jgi:hypothetical protein